MFQNAFRNVTCERPPRPRLFGTGPFLDGAATPPWQGGEYARLNLFTFSMTAATKVAMVYDRAHSPPREETSELLSQRHFFRSWKLSCQRRTAKLQTFTVQS